MRELIVSVGGYFECAKGQVHLPIYSSLGPGGVVSRPGYKTMI